LTPRHEGVVEPGDVAVEARFTNDGDEPVSLNLRQAAHPALVLEIRDEAGQPVLLPPPSAPEPDELLAMEEIEPRQELTVLYAGFLDRDAPTGTYRVRYFSVHSQLGGSPERPLTSEWALVTVRQSQTFRGESFTEGLRREVDEPRNETISNAPPGAEAWNGDYAWRSRFLVETSESGGVQVVVRIRLNGSLYPQQAAAWQRTLQEAWCNRHGFDICPTIEFVTAGEHYVVTVGANTANMNLWGANDTRSVRHELGHMLGNLDEYFTVNGVDYGSGWQPQGNIMNNPDNYPEPQHYDTIRRNLAGLHVG
jgi:hypothetical protein